MPSKVKVKGWKLMGWKSNGKIAVSMYDHYGVEARNKTMEERAKPFILCNGRDCGRCIWVSVRHTEVT